MNKLVRIAKQIDNVKENLEKDQKVDMAIKALLEIKKELNQVKKSVVK